MENNTNLEHINRKLKEENEQLKSSLQAIINQHKTNNIEQVDTNNNWFNKAQKNSKLAFWSYSLTEKKLFTSEKFNQLLEINNSNKYITDAKTIWKLLSPSEFSKIHDLKEQIANHQSNIENVFHFKMKDGSSRYIEVKANIENQTSNQVIYGSIHDVTETHYKIEKLKENEQLFQNLFDNLTDVFIIFETQLDKQGEVVDYIFRNVNPAFEMQFEHKIEDVINKPLSLQTQLYQQLNQQLKITAITRQAQQDRFYIQSLDQFMDILIYAPSKNTIATVWRNVTLMVKAEESLRENEEKYRQIFNVVYDGVLMLDFNSGNIMEANASICNMLNYTKDQLLELNFRNIIDQPDTYEKKIEEEKINKATGNLIKKDQSTIPFEASLSYFNWSGRKVIVVSFRDITQRQLAQQKVISSEKKYKHIYDYSNDAILLIKNYRIIDFNQKCFQLFKTNADELENKTIWGISPANQQNGNDSRTKIVTHIQQVLQGQNQQIEWNFQCNDKTTFLAELNLSTVLIDDEKIIQAIVRDISPRKQFEELLALNENRWKQALDISSIGVWDWNIDTNEVYFSRVWKRILGFEKDEFPNEFNAFKKRVHPDDIETLFNKIDEYIVGKQTEFNTVFRIRCKNGSYKWVNALGKILSYTNEGKPERFFGIHIDVTKQTIDKQKNEIANESYAEASQFAKLAMWNLDLRTMIIRGSAELSKTFGLETNDKISLKQIENLVHPEDQKNFISQFFPNQTDQHQSHNFRIIVDNQTKFISSVAVALIDSKNRIEGYRGIFQEITQLKKQELKLKDEQHLIGSFLDKTQQLIIIVQNQEVVYINDKFQEFTGFPKEEMALSLSSILDLASPEDKPYFQQIYSNVAHNNKTFEKADIRIETKHKRTKWVETYVSQIKFKDQSAVLIMIYDITERKNVEIKLAESEVQNELIKQYSPIGIAQTDLNGVLLEYNNEFKNIIDTIGISSHKIELKQLMNDMDYFNIKAAISAIKSLKIKEYRNEIRLKNNVNIKVKIDPIFDQNNYPVSLIVYFNNVDLFKKQIEILTEDNSTLKAVVENSSAGLGIFNSEGELIIHNQSLLKDLDIDIYNKALINFNEFNFNFKNKLLIYKDIIKLNNIVSFEYKIGTSKILYIEIRNISANTSNLILVVTRDITDIHNRGVATVNQLERFHKTFDEMPIGCALVDKNRNIIECNKKYASILNYTTDQLKYKKLDQLVHVEYLSEMMTKFSELFSGVVPRFDQLFQMVTSTEKNRWITSKSTFFTDQFNDIVYAIQIIEDVTNQKENEYNNVNEERLKTLNHIANSFAHKFNNLLMSIYGNNYLIRHNTNDENIIRYSETLLDSLNKSSDLTHNLLTFSFNKNNINVKINITKLIEELLNQFNLPSNISTKTHFDKKNENIIGDPSQLYRALNNIVENACDAMPQGGEISIETKSVYFDENTSLQNTKIQKGKYIRISITDNGKGIHQSNLAKVFDPFFTTKTEKLYAGLGLSIVHNIISDHQGIINAESQYFKGSSFMVYLPLVSDEFLQNNIQPNEQLLVKSSANIIIIDDEDIVRNITSELLKKLGYNVFSFSNGKNAIQFYTSNIKSIDLVILDKQMPDMDGLLVFNKLKQINSKIKAIMLTGYNIDKEITDTFNDKNNLIVQKPVSIEKLSTAISQLLLK